ncbi:MULTISPECIES: DUF2213 domain-containing protein [unclassified Shinella]|uniref:DUF2213 domain-containing protein n=1 Tax=unclassified Shinella TaxID=2643062 RepID=UPI00234E9091|nr:MULTISPECIES: DUF2213 domain-containing protein [unclassified Shinella]MCO5152574.1 DUF2213 domain-containing protein [Shinella sp.]MDC7261869.1 DUF2213 domain-containing protein [Shinella sp. HY16]MDC7268764.1 DUF2213 domain-containing protein [Shinella sp. YZ44]
MNFIDVAPIARTRRTADGYLVAEVRTARTGIQEYAGWEVGKPDMPVVKVYRPADQVFSRDSMSSYAHKPVTNDHPDEAVSATNWKQLAVGSIGDEIARDGDFVRIPLIVMDATAINLVEGGKRELSAGYTCDLSFESGTTPDGLAYDAIQKDIRINHVAIVQNGRAGSKARIGDGAKSWGASPVILPTADMKGSPMADNLRKVLVDGLQVETTDAGAAAIEKLTKDKADLAAKLADVEKAHALATADAATAHEKAVAAKDEEIGTLKADLKKAKDAIPSPEALAKLVADRVALEATVKAVAKDVQTEGVSDADIRKAAVATKLGDEMVKDASDAEIAGMFKAIAKDAATSDPVRAALLNRDTKTNVTDNGQAAYEKRLADAWKKGA